MSIIDLIYIFMQQSVKANLSTDSFGDLGHVKIKVVRAGLYYFHGKAYHV